MRLTQLVLLEMTSKNQIVIRVVSYIPYLEDTSKEYFVEQNLAIGEFVTSLGIKWDEDALVVINRFICNSELVILQDGDVIELLIPLSGG